MQNIQTDPTQMQRILQALGLNTVEEVAQFGQPITAQNAAAGMQPPPQPQQVGPPLMPLPPPAMPQQQATGQPPMPQQPPMQEPPPPQPTIPPANAEEGAADMMNATLNTIDPTGSLTQQNLIDEAQRRLNAQQGQGQQQPNNVPLPLNEQPLSQEELNAGNQGMPPELLEHFRRGVNPPPENNVELPEVGEAGWSWGSPIASIQNRNRDKLELAAANANRILGRTDITANHVAHANQIGKGDMFQDTINYYSTEAQRDARHKEALYKIGGKDRAAEAWLDEYNKSREFGLKRDQHEEDIRRFNEKMEFQKEGRNRQWGAQDAALARQDKKSAEQVDLVNTIALALGVDPKTLMNINDPTWDGTGNNSTLPPEGGNNQLGENDISNMLNQDLGFGEGITDAISSLSGRDVTTRIAPHVNELLRMYPEVTPEEGLAIIENRKQVKEQERGFFGSLFGTGRTGDDISMYHEILNDPATRDEFKRIHQQKAAEKTAGKNEASNNQAQVIKLMLDAKR